MNERHRPSSAADALEASGFPANLWSKAAQIINSHEIKARQIERIMIASGLLCYRLSRRLSNTILAPIRNQTALWTSASSAGKNRQFCLKQHSHE